MPEIFRFTQLREPTGINIEEVRQEHIQFFDEIEEIQSWGLNTAFTNGFEEGIKAVKSYLETNEGFLIRVTTPKAVITKNWSEPLYEGFRPFFELCYLLSQYKSDKKKSNESLFSQISDKLSLLNSETLKEDIMSFYVYFEDLLALYFQSSKYPSYLRLLIGLRRWHFVFGKFTLEEIQEAFVIKEEESEMIFDNKSVLYFLFKAKILLPKYLFTKTEKEDPVTDTGGVSTGGTGISTGTGGVSTQTGVDITEEQHHQTTQTGGISTGSTGISTGTGGVSTQTGVDITEEEQHQTTQLKKQ